MRGKPLVSLLVFLGILLLTFAGTRLFLEKPAVNTMGMKMDMSKPNLGMEAAAPKAVAVEPVKSGPLAETVTYTGTVAPYLEETVYPRVIGWLSKMPLYPGDRVVKGEEIAKLDWGELYGADVGVHPGMGMWPHNVAVAEMSLRASRAKEREASNELRKAKADLAYWRNEFPREKILLQQGAIAKEEYDREKSQYKSALFEVGAKKDALQAASQERKVAEHGLSAIWNYRILRAHISGVVTERMVNEGVLVQPDMGILKIAQMDRVRVQAFVAESDLSKIRAGTPAAIRSPKLPHRVIHTRVTSIFHAVDPEARTGTVEALIGNPGQKLFPGDYCIIDFILSRKRSVLSVPVRALTAYRGGTAVWVDENGLAERKKVKTGISNGLRTEIRSGLLAGDKVIVAGQQDLVPGEHVVEATWGSGNYSEVLFPETAPESPSQSMPGMQMNPAQPSPSQSMPGMPGMEKKP